MASDSIGVLRARTFALLLALMLAVSAVFAWQQRASPRGLTVAGIAAAFLLMRLWTLTGQWLRRPAHDFETIPERADSTHERQRIHLLEIREQHAPIAMFKLVDGHVSPLNAYARRIVAPGFASDVDALYRELAANAHIARSVVQYESEHGQERALVSRTSLIIDGQIEYLVALMPVESELEAETLRAWQQLVNTLTHEIMNSLTPVASLAQTASRLLEEVAAAMPEETQQDLRVALEAIGRRATGLIDFVTSYRDLAALPIARVDRVILSDLMARIEVLFGPNWLQRGGTAKFSVDPPTLELVVDAGQLEQVLINLARNAFEATEGVVAARLDVQAALSRGGRLRIEVADNGPGVQEELISQIFTPFFSTKAKGRGIGLALVRQLVHANGGTVRYIRRVQSGACFVLTF